MAGSDLSPGEWKMVRSRGDIMIPDVFILDYEGSPWNIESAKAQVRRARNRMSELIFNLPVDINGDEVTVRKGLFLSRDSGEYWWDLQVVDEVLFDSDKPFTILSGPFILLGDVTL